MRIVTGALFLLIAMSQARGRLLEVPSGDYPTIQAAIDSSVSGDTILIGDGSYAEALLVENRNLRIMGTEPPDSATGAGTIIDPSPLDSSNYAACLRVVGGDSVAVERIWFRNGEAMHIGRPSNQIGGIDNREGPPLLRVSECRFDSVYRSIVGGGEVRLDGVRMSDCRRSALYRSDSTRFVATDCLFQGLTTLYMVVVWSRSEFVRCVFQNESSLEMLVAGKDSILVSGCRFGPFSSNCGGAVLIRAGSGTVIENNIFEDCQVGTSVLHVSQATCTTDVGPNSALPHITGNVFRNISHWGCQGGFALELHCDGGIARQLAIVEDNRFIDSQSSEYFTSAVYVYEGGVTFEGNTFENLLPETAPAVFVWRVFEPESSVFHSNSFDSVAYAIEHFDPGQFTDARWNWWGDNSGPYNAFSNPAGLGAEVDNNVLIDPWLTREDTGSAVEHPQIELPLSPGLAVYPNPFNAVTTLSIEVARSGEYVVRLYDVTGRLAGVLFDGRIEFRQEIVVTAGSLPSGVYFAQLSNRSSALAVTKVALVK